MPRVKRCRLPEIPQLVFQRGHNDQRLFHKRSDYETFLADLADAALVNRCSLHGYAITPRCVYVLCTPAHGDSVSRTMQTVGARYARYFNQEYARSGALWSGRYRSCLVEPGHYLLACHLYVDTRAARSNYAHAHDWSSAAHHCAGARDTIVCDHDVYRSLASSDAERQLLYQRLMQAGLRHPSEAEIEQALFHGLVLGSDDFKDRIARLGHERVRLGKPGRPRKRTPASRGGVMRPTVRPPTLSQPTLAIRRSLD